ncbi:MAG TPA: alpha/beta fold hydrolase, partial [Bdellovibrionales bacterium]|nr:alpha/beta fold hydrolase [Bdellovibrionales bacterium]
MTNVLLHGFWGQPRDWNKVLARLELSTAALTPDLYASGGLSPEHELGGPWEENFHGYLDMEAGAEPVNLIGYSMGARLALGAYFFKPERFSRVLLLSGNPVIPEEDRAARAEWERLWREKFLTQPWSELESGWQEIPVFSGDEPVKRQRAEPLRAMLGLSLSNWSPRRHGFGWERVRELPKTVDWAFGA